MRTFCTKDPKGTKGEECWRSVGRFWRPTRKWHKLTHIYKYVVKYCPGVVSLWDVGLRDNPARCAVLINKFQYFDFWSLLLFLNTQDNLKSNTSYYVILLTYFLMGGGGFKCVLLLLFFVFYFVFVHNCYCIIILMLGLFFLKFKFAKTKNKKITKKNRTSLVAPYSESIPCWKHGFTENIRILRIKPMLSGSRTTIQQPFI